MMLITLSMTFGQGSVEKTTQQKILIVTTSHNVLGITGYPTGLWLPELAHPYFVFTEAGYNVEVASLKGGKIPIDPYSMPGKGYTDNDLVSIGFLHAPVTKALLDSSQKLSNVNVDDYATVFFAGGNGAIYDFPNDKDVIAAATKTWESGKPLATVCHGLAALVNVKDKGQPISKGKKITGFCKEEEIIAEKTIVGDRPTYLPFYLEDVFTEQEAIWNEAAPYTPFVVTDGKLITGQQNFSAFLTAQKVIELLQAE
jgi:putative intracellular protease/amidase